MVGVIDIEFTAYDDVSISAGWGDGTPTIEVQAKRVNTDQLLSALDLEEMLDFVGRDKAKDYFDLVEEREEDE